MTALRLASWEKSRIEEIYTGHALRTFIKGSPAQPAPVAYGEKVTWNEPRSPLVKGKLEGWVKVRVMGGTDWKRLWLVVQGAGTPEGKDEGGSTNSKRRRSIFGFGNDKEARPTEAGVAATEASAAGQMQSIASAVFHNMPPLKGKNKSGVIASPPVLSLTHVSQA